MSCRVLEISVRSDIGGGPKHLLDLISSNNSNIELYCAIPFGYELSQNIRKASVDSVNIPHRKFSIFSFIEIIQFCRKNNIKIIHSHGRGAGYYSRPMKLLGYKVIHTLHGVHVEASFSNKLKILIDRILVPLTTKFICVSTGEKKSALKHKVIDPKKTQVIYNGVKPQQNERVQVEHPTIAMLGRLSFQKGYDLLIKSIEDFCILNPDLKFTINIAGDGEIKNILEKSLSKTLYAKDKINFVGQSNDPISFLSEHSHFLSFSRFEGMPISVLEAMSMGIPCMVSDVVGNNDIINESNGYLFNLSNFDSVFLNFLISDHKEQIKVSSNDILNTYNIQIQSDKTISQYISI
jgi:glycosyltransferase involved in cell wall biosynthesis